MEIGIKDKRLRGGKIKKIKINNKILNNNDFVEEIKEEIDKFKIKGTSI